MKKFRLNVIANYSGRVNPNGYRPHIHGLMKNIAWLHGLEYAIEENNQEPSLPESADLPSNGDITDVIYFRSTSHTQIEANDLRKIISCIFDKSSFAIGSVIVGYQLHKALRYYPFPKNYFRQLNYPYVEVYSDGNPEPKICVLANEYYNLLDSPPESN